MAKVPVGFEPLFPRKWFLVFPSWLKPATSKAREVVSHHAIRKQHAF